jgi:hypothetical protein
MDRRHQNIELKEIYKWGPDASQVASLAWLNFLVRLPKLSFAYFSSNM